MANRLKRFWGSPSIWMVCLCLLFGCDVFTLKSTRPDDLTNLGEILGKRKIMYPESLIIITTLLQQGMKDTLRCHEDKDIEQDERQGLDDGNPAGISTLSDNPCKTTKKNYSESLAN